jgi:hypothetical protein
MTRYRLSIPVAAIYAAAGPGADQEALALAIDDVVRRTWTSARKYAVDERPASGLDLAEPSEVVTIKEVVRDKAGNITHVIERQHRVTGDG